MISSNLSRTNHGSRVFIALDSNEGRAAGLRLDSVVMTDNIATLLETEIDSKLGTLTGMGSVENALKHTLSLR